MEVEFAFREEHSRLLGNILRPVAEVLFINGAIEILQFPYVDSGADLTLISKSVGDSLGLKLNSVDEICEIKGVGERGVPIVMKKIKMKIGEKVINTRIAWSLVEEVPLLLGREDVFNLFDISFKYNSKVQFKTD